MTAAVFSDEDFQTLSDWLMRRGTGIFDVVELEGFLTAIVIGPNTLSPIAWLPKVWGGKQPKFRDLDEMNRFLALVMGFYNEIVSEFVTAPDRFEPSFYERKVGRKRYLIVDEWCVGFLKGMRLDAAGWKPLKKERPDLLKPIHLFGSRAGWKEMETADPEKLHKTWSPKIAPAVREIHAFWLPSRRTLLAQAEETRH